MSGRAFTKESEAMALQAIKELDEAGRWEHYKPSQQVAGSPSNDKAPIAASATTSAGDSVEDSYQEGKLE